MGELEPWIDENFVRSVWFGMGEQVNVKMIRDKFSGCAYPTILSRMDADPAAVMLDTVLLIFRVLPLPPKLWRSMAP